MHDTNYCSKCKQKTFNTDTITTGTSNGLWRVSAQRLSIKLKRHFTQKLQEGKLLLAKELHKPVTKHFRKRRIVTKGIDDLRVADLINLKK